MCLNLFILYTRENQVFPSSRHQGIVLHLMLRKVDHKMLVQIQAVNNLGLLSTETHFLLSNKRKRWGLVAERPKMTVLICWLILCTFFSERKVIQNVSIWWPWRRDWGKLLHARYQRQPSNHLQRAEAHPASPPRWWAELLTQKMFNKTKS